MSRGVFVHVCVMYRLVVKMVTTRPFYDTDYEQTVSLTQLQYLRITDRVYFQRLFYVIPIVFDNQIFYP